MTKPQTAKDLVELELTRRLDYIQYMIWAGINDVLVKYDIRLTIGIAYEAGSSIKEVLHPQVRELLANQTEVVEEHKHRFTPNNNPMCVCGVRWDDATPPLSPLTDKELEEKIELALFRLRPRLDDELPLERVVKVQNTRTQISALIKKNSK